MRETVKNHQISFFTSINKRVSTKNSDNFSVEALYLCGHLGQLVVTSKFNLVKLLNSTLPQNHSIYQMYKMLKLSLDQNLCPWITDLCLLFIVAVSNVKLLFQQDPFFFNFSNCLLGSNASRQGKGKFIVYIV